jgi:UDP-glucuronate 4-epimerase
VRYLVTGSSGFIGAHTVRYLRSNGEHDVRGLDKRPDAAVTDFVLDLTLRDRLFSLMAEFRPDRIIHLAALGGVNFSLEKPIPYAENNVLATSYLLEAARQTGAKKVVLVSSSSVYGDSKTLPLKEDMPCVEPLSPYAAGKRAIELLGFVYSATFGMDVSVMRPFSVYGPNCRQDLVVRRFLDAALHGRSVEIYGDGSAARDFTYVDDVVRGLARAAAASGWGIYNLGAGRPVTVNELLDLVGKIAKRKVEAVYCAERPGEVRRTFADISNARRAFGWYPEVSLEEGLERTWQWLVSSHT